MAAPVTERTGKLLNTLVGAVAFAPALATKPGRTSRSVVVPFTAGVPLAHGVRRARRFSRCMRTCGRCLSKRPALPMDGLHGGHIWLLFPEETEEMLVMALL